MVSKRYYSTSTDTTLIQEWLKILIQNNNSNSAEINSNLEKIITSLNSISGLYLLPRQSSNGYESDRRLLSTFLLIYACCVLKQDNI